ncbi:hypothetical protein BB559_003613 [Furculomyces boomerangus]|uniref:Thiamine pyrophosphokinase n=1 Tax=Furculomyces boomerangus TaxID=61424 RepID=A0A2T9YK93_9FUNG|nr:hypothetical protein BB559_003613 [Furculomyces boomerangus]
MTDTDSTLHAASAYVTPNDSKKLQINIDSQPMALLMLNLPLVHIDTDFFESLWNKSKIRICADGAGNRLYEFGLKSNCLEKYIPSAIVGDLDSLLDKHKDYYVSKGTKIIWYKDQSSTDFQKSLRYLGLLEEPEAELDNKKSEKQIHTVVVLGGFGGRLDHTLHVLKVLLNECNYRRIIVISESNLTFALPKGKNTILINKKVDGPACGILPLAGECKLTTTGLHWDMVDHMSSVTGFMSTSNLIEEDIITVDSTEDVIWTCEFLIEPKNV